LLLLAAVLAWRAVESKRAKDDKAPQGVSVKCGTGVGH
jgi:hypothetical protein